MVLETEGIKVGVCGLCADWVPSLWAGLGSTIARASTLSTLWGITHGEPLSWDLLVDSAPWSTSQEVQYKWGSEVVFRMGCILNMGYCLWSQTDRNKPRAFRRTPPHKLSSLSLFTFTFFAQQSSLSSAFLFSDTRVILTTCSVKSLNQSFCMFLGQMFKLYFFWGEAALLFGNFTKEHMESVPWQVLFVLGFHA